MAEGLIVVCPSCGTLNRAPREKLDSGGGKCGQCGGALFQGKPLALTSGEFERHAGKSDIPLLVDFWAPWCGPCRMMAPHFEQAARRLEPKVRLGKVNTEEEQALAGRFQIRGIPTMILFQRGQEIARQSGAMDSTGIERWVEQVLPAQ